MSSLLADVASAAGGGGEAVATAASAVWGWLRVYRCCTSRHAFYDCRWCVCVCTCERRVWQIAGLLYVLALFCDAQRGCCVYMRPWGVCSADQCVLYPCCASNHVCWGGGTASAVFACQWVPLPGRVLSCVCMHTTNFPLLWVWCWLGVCLVSFAVSLLSGGY